MIETVNKGGVYRLLAAGVVIFTGLCGDVSAAEAIRVGLLASTGAEGMREVLAAEPDIEAEVVDELDEPTLFQFDVVILGSVKGGVATPDWLNAVDLYVRCGGGMLLHHDATGFRGWADSPFPELFKGTGRLRSRQVRITAEHPVTQGVEEEFEHAYFDHIVLEKRDLGNVLARDAQEHPVVIAGSEEHGRVVGNGMVTGYTADNGVQSEAAPEGGERTLLLNAVRWLAESRLTALPEAELTSRRDRFAADIALREASVMERVDARGGIAGGDPRSWYSESKLNEQGFVHPPVQLLPGRFFMFDGMFTGLANRKGTGRAYGEVRSLVRQMKWAGVTDIITQSGGPVMKFRYQTNLPNTQKLPDADRYGFDYLEVLCKAAAEEGLDVWGFWHPSQGGPYKISDPEGKPYGDLLDIKDPRVLEAAKRTIDELAERYNTHGNFKGIFIDELWHPFVYDRMEGQVDAYIAFCESRFGETPPDDLDLPALFAQGRDWHEPADKWWRRYVLFRNTFTVDFIEQVTEYANARGLRTMPQIGFGFNWFYGHGNTHRLARAGNMLWSYEHRNNTRYEHYPKDRVITATHTRSPSGYQLVAHLRGLFGSQFALEQTWLPVGFGKNPRAVEVWKRQIQTNRAWYGAEPMTRYAVLTNRIGLDLAHRNATDVFERNEQAVQLALSRSHPTAMLMVRDTQIYDRYPALIASQYALEYLPAAVYDGIHDYIRGGGHVLMLGTCVSTSREDHTQVIDRTVEFAGVESLPQGEAAGEVRRDVAFDFEGNTYQFDVIHTRTTELAEGVDVLVAHEGEPLISEHRHGEGRVVMLHFDVTRLLNDAGASPEAVRLMSALLQRAEQPALRIEGDVMTFSAIRKGNWVVVAFLPRGSKFDTTLGQSVPAHGRLHIDMAKLGIEADRYKVINLARDREMMPQGEDWDFFGRHYWTQRSLLEEGIDVFMPPHSLEHLELPSKVEDEYVRRWILPRWPSRARALEHDIIAIAPAAEPFPVADE